MHAVLLCCPAMPTQLSSWPTRTLGEVQAAPSRPTSGSRPPPRQGPARRPLAKKGPNFLVPWCSCLPTVYVAINDVGGSRQDEAGGGRPVISERCNVGLGANVPSICYLFPCGPGLAGVEFSIVECIVDPCFNANNLPRPDGISRI
jgi:hypothetical protein